MDTLKIPRKQYALSSVRLVSRRDDHRIRSAGLKFARELPRRAATRIPVASWMTCSSVSLSPRRALSREKNSTRLGARSSCSVQPRVNYLLFRKADSQIRALPVLSRLQAETSGRNTYHLSALAYHRNMDTIASESSIRFVLSIQHVSIQKYSR